MGRESVFRWSFTFCSGSSPGHAAPTQRISSAPSLQMVSLPTAHLLHSKPFVHLRVDLCGLACPSTDRDRRWLIRSPKVKMDWCRVILALRGKGIFLACRHQKLNCCLGNVQFISFSLSAPVNEKPPAVSAVSRSRKETKHYLKSVI